MPLDTSQTDTTGGFDTSAPAPGSFELGLMQDQQVAGRGMPLYQPSPVSTPTTGYATPQHAGVTALRGYDPLRTTPTWDPSDKPLTEAFNPFPVQDSPKEAPGEWNYLKRLGWQSLLQLGDQAVGIGRQINEAVGQGEGQGGWVDKHLNDWHQAIQSSIVDNIKNMGEGYRNAYEGSILRSLGVGPDVDEQGNQIPGVFEGGGGVGRFANWVAARAMEMLPVGAAALLTGGTGAVAMMGAQSLGDHFNAIADAVENTPDNTYQLANPVYRDLRQNQGMTEMQAKQQMLQSAMVASIADSGIDMAGAAVGMRGAPAAFSPMLRRLFGAVMGGVGFGAAGGAGSVIQQRQMTGDVDVTTAMREALNQGLQGVAMGAVFGAHVRGRPGETKAPGEPDATTAGVDSDAAAAIAARPKAPEQTEMFAPTQMGPTVAPSPEPRPTEPTTTVQPPGTAPIPTDRTPGPYAPQTYPAYGPEGPTVVSRPEGMPGASQPDILGGPTQGPSGPIVPPPPGGGPGGGGPAPRTGAVPPAGRPPPTGSAVPPSTQAAVATSKARGAGQAKPTPEVTPGVTPGALDGLTVVQRDSGDRYTIKHAEGSKFAILTKEGEGPTTKITLAADNLAEKLDTPGSPWQHAADVEGKPAAEAAPEAAPTPTPGAAEPAAEVPAEPKLTPYQMRQQLIEWGYKRTQVKAMRVADVAEAHAKGPDAAPGRAETPQEKPPVETEPEGVTIAATQAEPEPEPEPVAEAEKVPAAEHEQFPATPKEEGPPVAEPLTGRALEKAKLAAGREIPVKGEVTTGELSKAEGEGEAIPSEQGRLELPAPENTPENRREAMHALVQEHAPQVIQARGKANIDAMVKRAADYLHRAIEETDGTREGVAEKLNDALEQLPEGAGTMPGTTTTWRNYIAQMMTRLTGHEPTSAATERAEAEGVRREEQARVGAEPARKVSGEDIEQAVAAPVAGEGPTMEAVARKPEADTVTNVKRRAANIIKRLRDGDLTPAEAAAEYDKPVEGETRGAKRSKGYGTFREVLQTRLAQAADPRAERNILDEMHRISADRELTAAKRNAAMRKLENDLKNYGPEVAHELQDWLERLDDPVGHAVRNEPLISPNRMIAEPRGISSRSSRFVRTLLDERLHTNLVRAIQASEADGTPYTLHDALRLIAQDSMVRAEARPMQMLATRLLHLLPDMPVHSAEEVIRRYGGLPRGTENALIGRISGYASLDWAGEGDYIMLNVNRPHTFGNYVETLLHEAVHVASSRYIEQLKRGDPDHPDMQVLRLIGRELRAAMIKAWPSLDELESDRVQYALSDPAELHTMILTNPVVQAVMAEHIVGPEFRAAMDQLRIRPGESKASLWRYFTQWLRKVLGLPPVASGSELTLFDHVLRPGIAIAERGMASTRADIAAMTDSWTEANTRAALAHELPRDPELRDRAVVVANQITNSVGPRAHEAIDYIQRTIDPKGIGDRLRRALLASATTDGIVARYGGSLPALEGVRRAAEMIQFAGKDFSDRHADDVKDVARRIVRADDRNGLQSLMNDATLNEMHLRPGGDNSHLAQDQQGLLRELRTRYNNLSANDKEVYGLTTDLHDKMYQEIRDAQLRSMVNIHMPDATAKEAEDFVKAARTREGLDRYVDNTDAAHKDIVKAIADFHKLGYVNGDYFPLRRHGNYVVRYGDRDDPNSYGVEFYEKRAQAEARRKELLSQGVPDVYRVGQKAEDYNQIVPRSSAAETLINRLAERGFDPAQQAAVRDQMNRILVQQATRSARSRLQQTYRRRGIRGASEDQARALAYDFIANSQTVGHLLWGPARGRALDELSRNVDDLEKPGAPDEALSAVAARSVLNEMHKRSEAASDPDNFLYTVARKANIFNYAHSLQSLSHMVTSTMEAHTNSLALGGARYGYGRFGLNLSRALMQLGPKMAVKGAMNTINGVARELQATDWNLSHVARDRLINAGANASHMNRLFTELERAGLIDHTIMTDLRQQAAAPSLAGHLAGSAWNRFMNLTQASAHAVDVMNKSAIAKAAFDSHMAKFPGDVDGAINAGIEYARKAMPNYNTANRARIARGFGAPLMQFKNYGIHMYTVMANLAREMMHGENKFEAAKAFTGLLLTHSMMAGALTTIADPLRYIGGAYDLITGKAAPKDRQAAIRGWLSDTFGHTVGELVARGLPHALGIDVHHRVGLDNLLEIPELKAFDKSSAGEVLLGLATGATGENLQDQVTGVEKLFQGDVGGFLKGVVPRMIRDPLKAADLATKGVTDSRGKTILPASRLGAGAVVSQALGFQPATVSEFREGRNAALAERGEITSEHSRLEQKWLQADPADRPAVMAEIHAFNRDEATRRWGSQLTMDQLMRARAAAGKTQHTPFGLTLPAKAYQGARYAGRFANIGPLTPAAAGP